MQAGPAVQAQGRESPGLALPHPRGAPGAVLLGVDIRFSYFGEETGATLNSGAFSSYGLENHVGSFLGSPCPLPLCLLPAALLSQSRRFGW